MVPWEKDTWHESHVVCRVPPRTCVHVTCDTWTMEKVTHGKMNSRVRRSFLSFEGNQTIRWENRKKKGKEKKEKKMKKGKKMRKKKE